MKKAVAVVLFHHCSESEYDEQHHHFFPVQRTAGVNVSLIRYQEKKHKTKTSLPSATKILIKRMCNNSLLLKYLHNEYQNLNKY